MIVEFCGIPGGGKSTLAKAYVERHTSAVLVTLDMYKRWPVIGYGALFALRHPFSFFWLCMYVARYHMRGLFWYSFHLVIRAGAKYQKASLVFPGKTAVIDEGVIHAVSTLSAYPLEKDDLCGWISRMVVPDVACVSLSGDFHRFQDTRAVLHPRAMRGDLALNAWKSAVIDNTLKMISCLENRRKISVWHIPERTEFSLGETVEKLHAHLAAI